MAKRKKIQSITRIDRQGRTTVPKFIRDQMNLRPHDKVEFTIVGTTLEISKAGSTAEPKRDVQS